MNSQLEPKCTFTSSPTATQFHTWFHLHNENIPSQQIVQITEKSSSENLKKMQMLSNYPLKCENSALEQYLNSSLISRVGLRGKHDPTQELAGDLVPTPKEGPTYLRKDVRNPELPHESRAGGHFLKVRDDDPALDNGSFRS